MKKKWLAALAALCLAAAWVTLAGCGGTDDPEPIAVERVTLDATNLTLALGTKEKLKATVMPENADNKTVKWSSSNVEVATVGNDGTVAAVKSGTANITAQAGGKAARCKVTVKPLTESISLDVKTLTLRINAMRKLEATVTPIGAYNDTVIWESSDTAVATVNYDGNVKAVNVGTVTITAKVGDMKEECTIVIVNPQDIPTHTHEYSGGTCSVCGLWWPSISGGTIDGYGILTKYTTSEYQTEVFIPEGVTGIANNVFRGCKNLEKVDIPDGVKSIGDRAFSGCSSLESVSIPDGVTSIGVSVFSGCSSLESVSIPDGVRSIGVSAFSGCSRLMIVTIPDSVRSIGDSAFSECSSLKSVTIPEGVTKIGNNTFEKCSSLTSITIPCSVTSIGYSAFSGCRSITDVTIPEGVKTIGEDAFYFCPKLKSVTIPSSVTSIGEDAFSDCTNLNNIKYNGTESEWEKIDRCMDTGEYYGLYLDGLGWKKITGKDGSTWEAKLGMSK